MSGIEISEAAAATTNGRLGNEVVQTGTIETLALPQAAFDIVAFFDVLEHVRCPIDFLRRVEQHS